MNGGHLPTNQLHDINCGAQGTLLCVCVCVCVCVCARARARVRVCVRACVASEKDGIMSLMPLSNDYCSMFVNKHSHCVCTQVFY